MYAKSSINNQMMSSQLKKGTLYHPLTLQYFIR